jgi:hypothetical protein
MCLAQPSNDSGNRAAFDIDDLHFRAMSNEELVG